MGKELGGQVKNKEEENLWESKVRDVLRMEVIRGPGGVDGSGEAR